ncbi:MAG: polyprenol monophosphomannose synthase [Thermomicrobiales bacterium]|nr:polyprenol monophosphomannose synthase [Thermomicrobiales bacterium]
MIPLGEASIVVVIPTYNEAENIGSLVSELLALPCSPQILIVDDNSPDGTGEIADQLAMQYPGTVHVKHRAHKQGLGRAYVDGFAEAIGMDTDYIVQMDADHSHRPQDLQAMMNTAVATNADLVLGSRYIEGGSTIGWPLHRRWISRFGSWYAGWVVGVHIRDLTGGFKVWRRETLDRIDLASISSDGYGFQIETTWRAHRHGAHIEQVPIVFHDRIAGASKLSRSVVFEAAAVVWKLRFS